MTLKVRFRHFLTTRVNICESQIKKKKIILLIFLLKWSPCWLTSAKLHHWGHTTFFRAYLDTISMTLGMTRMRIGRNTIMFASVIGKLRTSYLLENQKEVLRSQVFFYTVKFKHFQIRFIFLGPIFLPEYNWVVRTFKDKNQYLQL